jgi:hypothetical protein
MNALFALYFGIVMAAITGWIINIIDLFHLAMGGSAAYGEMAFRAIGVFVAPIGAILGLFF